MMCLVLGLLTYVQKLRRISFPVNCTSLDGGEEASSQCDAMPWAGVS